MKNHLIEKYATYLNNYTTYKLGVENGTIRHNSQEDTERYKELCEAGASLGLDLVAVNKDITVTKECIKSGKTFKLHKS